MKQFEAICLTCGILYTYTADQPTPNTVCSITCDRKQVNNDTTFNYRVTSDIVIDPLHHQIEPINNESDYSFDERCKEAFEKLARQKYGVKATCLPGSPNGNFEYAFEANTLKTMLQYLTNEICGDLEQALWTMVTEINDAQ